MQVEKLYVYSVFLPGGRRFAQYVSKNEPPQVGEVITVDIRGAIYSVEVLDIDQKPTPTHESVILKVQPVV